MNEEAKHPTEQETEEVMSADVSEKELPAQEAPEPEQAEAPAQEPETPSELDSVKDQLAKEHDGYLRLAAEYDNFRKRSQKEKDELYTVIKAETVGKFLPVYDNLERGIAQYDEADVHRQGLELILRQFSEALTKLGVTEIEAKGQPFDPEKHNAVMHVEDETAGENTVVEVFQKGFMLGDKVLRFAMVKVAN